MQRFSGGLDRRHSQLNGTRPKLFLCQPASRSDFVVAAACDKLCLSRSASQCWEAASASSCASCKPGPARSHPPSCLPPIRDEWSLALQPSVRREVHRPEAGPRGGLRFGRPVQLFPEPCVRRAAHVLRPHHAPPTPSFTVARADALVDNDNPFQREWW